MKRIGIIGAAGRMGINLINAVESNPDTVLAGAVEQQEHPQLGIDARANAGLGAGEITIVHDVGAAAASCDVMIDFSTREALPNNLDRMVAANKPLVIGTTGLSSEEKRRIMEAAKHIPIVQAPNFSTGVTLLAHLVQEAARVLDKGFDLEIVETHHRFKKDSPSGTALRLADAASRGRGQSLDDVVCYGRQGQVGERPEGQIGIHAVRGGDVVGEHTVAFFGNGERIELTHKAASRMTFAHGAVRAALWVLEQPAGLYSMEDVLTL